MLSQIKGQYSPQQFYSSSKIYQNTTKKFVKKIDVFGVKFKSHMLIFVYILGWKKYIDKHLHYHRF
jgi:hypothetical protein